MAELAERALVAMQQFAPGAQRFVECHQVVAAAGREQQAGFLEAFADRRDVIVQAVRRQPELRAGRGIVEAGATRVSQSIARIDDAAGEDPGTAVVVAALGAPREQHLDARGGVAHHHQGGGRSGRASGRGSGRGDDVGGE